MKPIPAYKPSNSAGVLDPSGKKSPSHAAGGSNWNVDKTSAASGNGGGGGGGAKEKAKKRGGRKSNSSANLVSPKVFISFPIFCFYRWDANFDKHSYQAGNSRDSSSLSVIVQSANSSCEEKESKSSSKSDSSPFTDVLAGVGLVPGPRLSANESADASLKSEEHTSEPSGKQETPAKNCNSKPVSKAGAKKHADKSNDCAKVAKNSAANVFHEPPAAVGAATNNYALAAPAVQETKSRSYRRKGHVRSASPGSLGGNDTESTLSNVSDLGMSGDVDCVDRSSSTSAPAAPIKTELPAESETAQQHNSVIVTTSYTSHAHVSTMSQVHSSPSSSVATVSQYAQHPAYLMVPVSTGTAAAASSSAGGSSNLPIADANPINFNSAMFKSTPAEQNGGPVPQVKKARKGRTPKASLPPSMVPDSPPSSPDSAGLAAHEQQPAKRRRKADKSADLTQPVRENVAATAPNSFGHSTNHSNAEKSSPAGVNNSKAKPSALIDDMTVNMTRDMSSTAASECRVHNFAVESSFGKGLNLAPTTANSAREAPTVMPTSTMIKENTVGISVVKDNQLFSRNNGINSAHAPHMLGNQLNPASSMAQKMSDTLTAELEAHRVVSHYSPTPNNSLVGVPFPSRNIVSPIEKITAAASAANPFPQNLEQLLERQWEQGSQFLMEQAQHFDSKILRYCRVCCSIESAF